MKKDPYLVLGLTRTSTKEERKDAWKKLRSKHHPDKGGDATKFNQVNDAYEEVKDHPEVGDDEVYERTINFDPSRDVFGEFFHRRNSAQHFVNVDASISIIKAVNGGAFTLAIQLSGSTVTHYLEVDVPVGVVDGEIVRYPRSLRGAIDVNVTFHIEKDANWALDGLDVIRKESFDLYDLVLGCQRDVLTIRGGKVRVTVPKMTQPGSKLRIKQHGASSRQNFLQKGDMLVEVQVKIPDPLDEEILARIKSIRR